MTPKARNGPVEQMRVLLVAHRSARQQRIQTFNQLRHLAFCAPEPIRIRFKDPYRTGLVAEAAGMRPRKGSDEVVFTTNSVIRNLARASLGSTMRCATSTPPQLHRRSRTPACDPRNVTSVMLPAGVWPAVALTEVSLMSTNATR